MGSKICHMLLKSTCCKWQLSATTAGVRSWHPATGTPHCPGIHHKSCMDISSVTCSWPQLPYNHSGTRLTPRSSIFQTGTEVNRQMQLRQWLHLTHVPQERTGTVRLKPKVVLWIPSYSQIYLSFPTLFLCKTSYKPSHTGYSPDFPCHAKMGRSLINFLNFPGGN